MFKALSTQHIFLAVWIGGLGVLCVQGGEARTLTRLETTRIVGGGPAGRACSKAEQCISANPCGNGTIYGTSGPGTCEITIEIDPIPGAGKEACVLPDATKTDCDENGINNDCAEVFGCHINWEEMTFEKNTYQYRFNRAPLTCTDTP
jgi:hypothetical protein